MEEELRKRIFEPYFTKKEVGEGADMGSPISHAIIENHNAKMFVKSKVRKGSSFTIKSPVDANK